MTRLHVLEAAPHPWSHWGDYGQILVHGMTSHLPRKNHELQLERVGPFVPSVFFPGISDIVLNDCAKVELSSRVPGLTFRSVQKARIVRLYWSGWDASAPEPREYPASGEPEDYILALPHDPFLAEELGALWELVPHVEPQIQAQGAKARLSRYSGQHLIRANISAGYNFASDALQTALESIAPTEVCSRRAELQDDR